ncbi:type II toxin-antitoxin system mRNA interferase toxin, RelE/StbE family [Fretibacterium fastidiosum]|mgnify:FL=1|uniref:Addiction module toxin, RelE/StbE family n=1 Tax=Fretibacterium fastidiosum TaxID=651822 RepID=A0AB94IYC2_9BACT|nr:type II toxin-antitoxin system mRNA interferase toxin, RelE/StbE family [Fretibacterium fastidiosum]CBL28710.1 conserved hypothetical protein TIGR00053 [Fretibacterium fastidiosum]
MLKLRFSSKIQKDLKLLLKRDYDLSAFDRVVRLLAQNAALPESLGDHPLKGDWSGFRECHITSDWLLIYRVERDTLTLVLVRTGTHSDLFKK